MTSVFTAIVAIANAIQVVGDLLDRFGVFYFEHRKGRMKQENVEALKRAFEEDDQRDLEGAIGNSNPGEATNLPGSERRDSLPGVKP